MPNQGTTTNIFNQRCTDVAFHSKGTRPSWQTLLLPASWFIQSPHLHWDTLEVDWVWKRSHDHGKNHAESNTTPSHGLKG